MNFSRFRNLFIVTFLLASTAGVGAQQQPGEGAPAWQVLQYDISVSAGDASGATRTLAARVVLSVRNVGTGAGRTLTVRLNENAKIESASVGGEPARFTPGKDARVKLQTAQLQLPANIPPGSTISATFQYSLPLTTNTGLASISPEGLQFLPLSYWYPTPNTPVAPRGADYAPLKLTVNGLAGGDTLVSTGKVAGGIFVQTLNSQPFFVTGRFETVEGAGDARGVSALLHQSPSVEERREAEALIALAASARAFYAGSLGPAPDSPIRLVGVRRGAGFDTAGTLLLDHAAFRRQKIDSVTATQIADAVARLWVGGATPVEGEGAGVVREGLSRYLALLFVEKQFGKAAADAELTRMAMLYAPVAERDAPLARTSPAFDTYFNSATNKGALVWRLLASAAGREAFAGVMRAQLGAVAPHAVSLASLRERLAETGGDRVSRLMSSLFDLPTDTDLMVGLPQQRAGAWVSNLRNTGSFDVDVMVEALTDRGERLTTTAHIQAKDFGEAQFKTASNIVRVEIDPEKLYPQTNYANDVAPQGPGTLEAIEQARIQLGQQPAQAETLARAILARAPTSEDARVVLARALLEENRLDDAEREFRAALDSMLPLPATLAWSNIGLGEIALKRNRAGEAAKLFDAAVKIEADYPSALAARADRLKAETAAGTPPAPDEQIKSAVAALDAAIRGGRKTEIDALIVPGELPNFSKGIVGTQPDLWQTNVLRTDQLGPDRFAADVTLTARTLGKERSGQAVYVFARTPAGWKLSEIPIFEVR
ncbi:MAG TPA: tetratricopeptide repeat protein [Pyrinomonadaceae bacterium]|jgi:tetratricopeptide (TPR) repeat protein|nr:tetratricopeptide repeat protein [Pyrinomonadaceae bacterium]